MKTEMTLKCYCCGTPLGADFSLVALREDADRVFVMLPQHVERVEDGFLMNVQRVKRESKA